MKMINAQEELYRQRRRKAGLNENASTMAEAVKWYAGDAPTTREALAQIYKTTRNGQDRKAFDKLYTKFLAARDEKTGIFYNPYAKATNTAPMAGLAGLGVDTGRIDDQWFENYKGLLAGDAYTFSGNLGSAGKTKSPAANAAAWYRDLYDAEKTTRQAESEWAGLQKELTYWARKGLSDAEALSRIDWEKYGTLQRMDQGRRAADPLKLNRPMGYSQDALYGVLWAARNGGGTGNALADMAQSARGVGAVYKPNARAEAMRNPGSRAYNPYTQATADAEAMFFGVDAFTPDWFEQHKQAVYDSGDEQAVGAFNSAYQKELTTQEAEKQLQDMYAAIDDQIANGVSAESVLAYIRDEGAYATLFAMDKARRMGGALGLTRGVDYRWEDVESYVARKALEKKHEGEKPKTIAEVGASVTMNAPAETAKPDNAAEAAESPEGGYSREQYETAQKTLKDIFNALGASRVGELPEEIKAAIANERAIIAGYEAQSNQGAAAKKEEAGAPQAEPSAGEEAARKETGDRAARGGPDTGFRHRASWEAEGGRSDTFADRGACGKHGGRAELPGRA